MRIPTGPANPGRNRLRFALRKQQSGKKGVGPQQNPTGPQQNGHFCLGSRRGSESRVVFVNFGVFGNTINVGNKIIAGETRLFYFLSH